MTKEIRILFLTLWDKAVGTEDYDKDEWLRFEELLFGANLKNMRQECVDGSSTD